VEIRVCDAPLTVERAAALAAYAQVLAARLLRERESLSDEDLYLAYSINRFQACRFGLDGDLIDPGTGTKRSIGEDLLASLDSLGEYARDLDAAQPCAELRELVVSNGNDARWMREIYSEHRSLADLVWQQAERWRGASP
jgi:carboxylate-amine ligase